MKIPLYSNKRLDKIICDLIFDLVLDFFYISFRENKFKKSLFFVCLGITKWLHGKNTVA